MNYWQHSFEDCNTSVNCLAIITNQNSSHVLLVTKFPVQLWDTSCATTWTTRNSVSFEQYKTSQNIYLLKTAFQILNKWWHKTPCMLYTIIALSSLLKVQVRVHSTVQLESLRWCLQQMFRYVYHLIWKLSNDWLRPTWADNSCPQVHVSTDPTDTVSFWRLQHPLSLSLSLSLFHFHYSSKF